MAVSLCVSMCVFGPQATDLTLRWMLFLALSVDGNFTMTIREPGYIGRIGCTPTLRQSNVTLS